MDITEPIVNHIVSTEYDRLPPSAVHSAKRCILDCLGVAIAGYRSLGVAEVVNLFVELGGIQESKIWVYQKKVSALHAAFANSVMAHALDYDDSYRPGIVHPTCSVLPTALSMCQKIGKKNGKH